MQNAVLQSLSVSVFTTAPVSIVQMLHDRRERCGDATAIYFNGKAYSWADLDDDSTVLAHGLRIAGVRTDDFVTIALPNSVDYISVVYAVWKLGAIPQPVSSRLPSEELYAIVDLANARVVVSEHAFRVGRPVLSPAELRHGGSPKAALPAVISRSWKAPTSGGSTGRPKLIVSGSPAVSQERTIAMWGLSESDTVVMTGPMYHNAPFIIVFPALMAGARVILAERFDAEETLRMVHEHRATFLYLVPTMMTRISKLPEAVRDGYDMSSLRKMWHMAAPCPGWLKEQWIAWLGPDTVWELYGGTEGVAFTILDGNEWLERPGSVGTVAYGSALEAFSADGAQLARGTIGELFMQRDPVGPRPYRYIGADDRTIDEDWFSIGDFGWIDEDGYVFLADRRSDLILVGGSNVYPAEVEAALDEHPAVQSSCVIGLPDRDLGARIHAIVQSLDDLDETTLGTFLTTRLAKSKRPHSFEFVREPLRDEAGKVRRSALRQQRLDVS